uniref:Uncharacterized protein n=1 Tax=Siphoviridae sp. ctqPo10 TaxID=2827948 RepID=A0A8S5SWI8_9CAUD|nr:MAG TPA: hypothetical protein [Siphoviridae sp. ctqPo10]DAR46396.1 MAG TPA: hypothetical protein [Caudoviricetes sp.]DAS30633.1 MAG TPA: hypothetical protein [Caudoviricetes sp.]DAZ78572.1 MAG TPA: hypothetical protein [Caudoviricetes sp.]
MSCDYFLTTSIMDSSHTFSFYRIFTCAFAIAPYDYCYKYSGFPPLFLFYSPTWV